MELGGQTAWTTNWAWGLPLLVLSTVIHVLGLGLISEKVVRTLERMMDRRRFTAMFAAAMSVTVLLATVLHAVEAALWAVAYLLLGALPDARSAMLYSLSALTSYGHASIFLAPNWQLMGAVEALNGMLLFGLTTAFLFAMIQRVWPLGSRAGHERPSRPRVRATHGGDALRQRWTRWFPFLLLPVLAACNPYVAATSVVHETYGAATDLRSLSTQESDTQVEVQLKAALLASPVRGTTGIDAWCRQGVVVLAGVVPPGSSAGQEAVRLARQTPGVKRVETYFVSARPSWTSDFEIKEEIRAVLVADPSLLSGRVDIGVYAGHVVLVGVVGSPQKAEQFVAGARSVNGVVSVKSFMQTS
jgi:osmotically-inducible protein OsmY